ncbi:hypothetical protein D3C80_2095030 [compost metagenome]
MDRSSERNLYWDAGSGIDGSAECFTDSSEKASYEAVPIRSAAGDGIREGGRLVI